ncbi:MAG: ATP-binding protein [Actinomyces sp.]|nr:ATP-binding protein [Actinomyces sp.]
MPEVLTLVLVAALGLLVGAVGVGAFVFSERQRSAEDTVEVEHEGLPGDVLSVLTALPGIAIVLERDDSVMRADAAAYSKGLVRGNALAHGQLSDLVHRVRRGGLAVTDKMQLPRSSISASTMLDFEVRVAALPAGRILLLAEDLTAQRRLEATRRDFTANVSHELKTPVGAIQLLAETIADNPGDEEAVAHFAPRLRRESERLSALVQDIIDLSRLQEPDALAAAELLDVDDVVSAALLRQETIAEANGVELVGPLTSSHAHVWGDRDMLVTAVRNLVDNAVRYSPHGGRVSVGVEVHDDLVSLSVVDSGVGISVEDQARVFERFYRVDPARSRSTGGTGLGLSIVKHVAADHGGTVTVWSRPGRGSTFTLGLPRAPAGGGAPGGEEDGGDEGGAALVEGQDAHSATDAGRGGPVEDGAVPQRGHRGEEEERAR